MRITKKRISKKNFTNGLAEVYDVISDTYKKHDNVKKITIEVVEETRDVYSADTNKIDDDGGPYKWKMIKVDA